MAVFAFLRRPKAAHATEAAVVADVTKATGPTPRSMADILADYRLDAQRFIGDDRTRRVLMRDTMERLRAERLVNAILDAEAYVEATQTTK